MSATTRIEAISHDDLGYLKLHRAAEVFATLAEGEHRTDRLVYLAALIARRSSHRKHRLNARLCFAHFRPDAPSRSSTSTSGRRSPAI